ncbi:MAG: hypothetical protein B7Y53_06545 [Halothiobacillus sp. 28-55-5]|nr:MAG: hypothetical protein B7Y53_06545 [Halothiobacillus sp. 28-55-5]
MPPPKSPAVIKTGVNAARIENKSFIQENRGQGGWGGIGDTMVHRVILRASRAEANSPSNQARYFTLSSAQFCLNFVGVF